MRPAPSTIIERGRWYAEMMVKANTRAKPTASRPSGWTDNSSVASRAPLAHAGFEDQ